MSKKHSSSQRAEKRSFYCNLCARSVRIPTGWTRGPAVRKHYWAKHPEVMQPDRSSAR